MSPIRLAAALLLLPVSAFAEMRAEPVRYEVNGVAMSSVLVYDDAATTQRPGLVMVPNWMGVNDAQIEKAKAIAGKDFVILVADVYGADQRPTTTDAAAKASAAMYADRAALRARANAAVAQLRASKDAPIDLSRIGAIGFCFGGATVLELARSGADIAAVASFHGNLATDLPAQAGAVKARVLAMNGADDGFVPADQIQGFWKEMQQSGADWQFANFGGAVHCFAEPDANGAVPGCVYNERAAKRAFAMMRAFFAESFAAQ